MKLYSFNVRGRGEPARLMLHYVGVPFEDIRYTFEEFPVLKKNFPFGQMPVLEIDGKQIAQTQTINRYIAKKFGLAGKNEWEEALADQALELYRSYIDASSPYMVVALGFQEGDKEKLRNEKFLPSLEKYAPMIKKLLTSSGFFVPSGVTYADFYMAELVDSLYGLEKELVDSKYPFLIEHSRRVHSLPQLSNYLKTRIQAPI